jgi:hypothetical protein
MPPVEPSDHGIAIHGKPNALQPPACVLVRHAKIAGHFTAADAVLAFGKLCSYPDIRHLTGAVRTEFRVHEPSTALIS